MQCTEQQLLYLNLCIERVMNFENFARELAVSTVEKCILKVS